MNVEQCIDKINKIKSINEEILCAETHVDDNNMIRIDKNLADDIFYLLKEYKYYLEVQDVPML